MTKRFKINPDLTCPELAGYKLPSFPRSQEDDMEALAESQYPIKKGGSAWMPTTHDCNQANKQEGFISGYTKAREKFEFSEADMVQAFAYGKTLEPFDSFDDFISNIRKIRTPRTPIAIEVEMVQKFQPDKSKRENELNGVYYEPKLNPDGTVKVVKWIFND